MNDSRKREIRPGQRVAYNMSGNIALGEVLDVQRSHVKIQQIAGGYTPHRGPHISRVKNGGSIMILQPSDWLNDAQARAFTLA